MSSPTYLTIPEVVARYRGQVAEGTFANWRVRGQGPSYIKVGKSVLYPLSELEAWDKRLLVNCGGARNRAASRDGED